MRSASRSSVPEFTPPFAPHVRGEYPDIERDPETGEVEPTVVALSCARCGCEERRPCASGRPRAKVLAFALAHLACEGKVPA